MVQPGAREVAKGKLPWPQDSNFLTPLPVPFCSLSFFFFPILSLFAVVLSSFSLSLRFSFASFFSLDARGCNTGYAIIVFHAALPKCLFYCDVFLRHALSFVRYRCLFMFEEGGSGWWLHFFRVEMDKFLD